jgi:hypothetical protein
MSLVQGRNVLLKILSAGTYQTIACNQVCTLEMGIEEIESTFLGSGADKSYIPGKITRTLRGNGPIYLDRDVDVADVYGLATARQLITWSFECTDNDASTISYTGTGFFTSVTITGDVNNAADCAYTIRVTGEVSASTGLPSVGTGDAAVLVYTASGGEISFADALLIGGTVIDVERNGVGLIVTSSAPSVNEAQFNSGTGTITFNYALGAAEYIQVIYFN